MCWLQAIALYPVYHGDETKSGKNHTAVLHHLRVLQVCGFRLFRGAVKSPRTHAFSAFHAVALSVTVLTPLTEARLLQWLRMSCPETETFRAGRKGHGLSP